MSEEVIRKLDEAFGPTETQADDTPKQESNVAAAIIETAITLFEAPESTPVKPETPPTSPVSTSDDVIEPITSPQEPTSKPDMPQNVLLVTLDQLVEYVKSVLGSNKLTAINIVTIMTNLVQIVEHYNNLTGSQKKMLVLDTIKKIINETVDDKMDRMQLLALTDLTMPHIIDTVVSAINGNVKFKKEKVISWIEKIFCCTSCKK